MMRFTLGEIFLLRLHPLSIAELIGKPYIRELGMQYVDSVDQTIWEDLVQFGGFPEVYYSQDIRDLKRWHNDGKTTHTRRYP